MKKGLLVLFAAVLLAGCGGEKEKVVKTCKTEEEGMSAVFDMEGEGDKQRLHCYSKFLLMHWESMKKLIQVLQKIINHCFWIKWKKHY